MKRRIEVTCEGECGKTAFVRSDQDRVSGWYLVTVMGPEPMRSREQVRQRPREGTLEVCGGCFEQLPDWLKAHAQQ